VLSIQPPSPTPAQDEQIEAQQLGVGTGWIIPIVARVNGRGDLSAAAGLTSADAGHAIWNPPVAPGGVDVYFLDDRGRRLAQYLKPYTSEEVSWDFVVSTDIPDSDVQVALPDLSALPAHLTVTLSDLDGSRHIYARTVPVYTFGTAPEGVTQRHFRLTVGPRESRGLVLTSASARQSGNRVVIGYSVNSSCRVTIQMLNIAGRLLKTVSADQPVASGVNASTWLLRDQTGRAVPAGCYLTVIEVVADDGQRFRTIIPVNVSR
jgi:hypothetical protein